MEKSFLTEGVVNFEKKVMQIMDLMSHSYEEIRSVALDILAGREKVQFVPSQYENLKLEIGKVFARREGKIQPGNFGAVYPLGSQDSEIFLEVFWDLFRQGIITLGLNDCNREFPFFRVSQLGKRIIENNSIYFFHDVSSYEQTIRSEVPTINDDPVKSQAANG